MTARPIFCIVEGDGEVKSIGLLLRRIDPTFLVLPPLRLPRSQMVKEGHLRRALELAERKVPSGGRVLVLMDADDDPACQLGPATLANARASHGHLDVRVVLAVREFEAWFLGALESLPGCRGIPKAALTPLQPESARGSKEALSALMGRPYEPVIDQPALAAVFSIEMARARCPSFDKLLREMELPRGLPSASGAG